MPISTSHGSPDGERMLAHRLQLWRLDCGSPSYEELARRMGHRYSATTVFNRLTTGRKLDRRFVRALVTACHQYAEQPGEPEVETYLREIDILQGRRIRPQWIGTQVSLATAYQVRRVDARLRDALRSGGTIVIRGNGGVGKTQLAAEIAQSSWTDQRADLLVWLSAISPDSVRRGYAAAATALGLDGDPALEAAAERFRAWLAEPHGRHWILVLDDLADPADLHGLWPPVGSGNTIVTTRRRDAALEGAHRTMIDLDVFDPDESVRYLTERLGHPLDGAEELCRELGHLPLALAQAAAYIRDLRLDCAGYLARFRTRRLADLEQTSNVRPDGYAAALSTTWRLSIETADRDDPDGTAGPLLGVAAWLDPNGIPAGLFWSAPVLAMLTAVRGRETTRDDVADGLANLERQSLCRFDDAGGTLRVHQLEQRVVREASTRQAHDLVICAADALLAVWPAVERDPGFVNLQRINAETLLRRAETVLTSGGIHQVLFRAGNSLSGRGMERNAVAYWERLLPVARTNLGAEHPDTLVVRNNLAWARGRAGQAERALADLLELLPIRERVLGPDDENTLATLHGIAVWQAETGDAVGATKSLRALVRTYVGILGADHRDTLNTRLTLIETRARFSSPAAVLTELLAVVEDYHRVLGADHPETLEAELLLVTMSTAAGDTSSAAERAASLLPRAEKTLGLDDLFTLQVRFVTADIHARAGDRDRATAEMRALLVNVQSLLDQGNVEVEEIRRDIGRWSAPSDGEARR